MLVSIFLLACVPPAAAQASAQGQWQTLPNLMPINPVHAALLHNGKVLIVSGSGNLPSNTNLQAAVFDPGSHHAGHHRVNSQRCTDATHVTVIQQPCSRVLEHTT